MLALLLALTAQSPDLTVTTFNIRYGTAADGENRWALRRQLALEVLRAQDADIVGLQEALRFQLDEIGRAFPEYGELGVGRDDGETLGEYAAILYRRERLAVSEHGTFWLSPTPSVVASAGWGNRITRICTWARFTDRASGRSFYVLNMHFDHESQPSRERAAELVSRRIRVRAPRDPVVVLGDFNAGEDNPARRHLLAAASLRDAIRVVHPDATEVGTFNGFDGIRTGEMIDAILIAPEWDVSDAWIDRTARDGRYPSDHFPVTARLRLSR
ncbi:MAG TPA: endonuclease/exonuclease/phosphatase family protein [Gemmatimonadales bacterium]